MARPDGVNREAISKGFLWFAYLVFARKLDEHFGSIGEANIFAKMSVDPWRGNL